MAIFNVLNYGASANNNGDDTKAIQAALDAAYNAGGGEVYIPKGTFIVSGGQGGSDSGALRVRDNVTLRGEGMGETILKVADGWSGKITGVVRTPYGEETSNVEVYDLTLDGNRANTSGKVDGFFTGVRPGSTDQDTNITVARVEIKNMEGYGFDPHEQTVNLSITDSVAHHNGLDGFVADFIIDSIYEGNTAYANDRHGFNVTTSTNDFVLKDNVAYDNEGAGIVLQRGSEAFPHPENIQIIGGEYYNNDDEGILVKLSDNVTIDGAEIYGNGTNGIRIYGADNTVVKNSDLHNNSQRGTNKYDEIRIQEYDDTDGATGIKYDSDNTLIENNDIYSNGAATARHGINEYNDGSDYTSIVNNNISGVNGKDIILNGSNSSEGGDSTPPPPPSDDGELILGTNANDTLEGGAGDDTIDGGAGKDKLTGGDGADIFRFSKLTDSVKPGSQYDSITDFKNGTDMFDLSGLGFDDFTTSSKTSAGELRLAYSAKTDRSYIRSDQEDFEFFLEGDYRGQINNNDFIFEGSTSGGGNNDGELILGTNGRDTLVGTSGDDTIDGGAGKDKLTGGNGSDIFRFSKLTDSVQPGSNYDSITDFQNGSDKFQLTGLGFDDFTTSSKTSAGELRLAYSAKTDRSYIRSDQEDFEFFLQGDFRGLINDGDFIF